MAHESVCEFARDREEGQERLLEVANLPMRRFLALDGDVYADGTLSRVEKERLGLVASVVLRCDDCIRYHLKQIWELGGTREDVVEVLGVALVAGGSVVIPHLRRAVSFLLELEKGSPPRATRP